MSFLQRRTGALLVTAWYVLLPAGLAGAGLGEWWGLPVAAAGAASLVAAARR